MSHKTKTWHDPPNHPRSTLHEHPYCRAPSACGSSPSDDLAQRENASCTPTRRRRARSSASPRSTPSSSSRSSTSARSRRRPARPAPLRGRDLARRAWRDPRDHLRLPHASRSQHHRTHQRDRAHDRASAVLLVASVLACDARQAGRSDDWSCPLANAEAPDHLRVAQGRRSRCRARARAVPERRPRVHPQPRSDGAARPRARPARRARSVRDARRRGGDRRGAPLPRRARPPAQLPVDQTHAALVALRRRDPLRRAREPRSGVPRDRRPRRLGPRADDERDGWAPAEVRAPALAAGHPRLRIVRDDEHRRRRARRPAASSATTAARRRENDCTPAR